MAIEQEQIIGHIQFLAYQMNNNEFKYWKDRHNSLHAEWAITNYWQYWKIPFLVCQLTIQTVCNAEKTDTIPCTPMNNNELFGFRRI